MNQKWQNRIKKVKGLWGNRAVVLMYHRIANPACDPWGLAVSPDNFEKHLQIILELGKAVSLQDLMNQLEAGTIRNKSIVLTFDDGYADNFLAAKPLLEKYRVPATFFIPTGNIGEPKEFWWDELERIIMQTEELPTRLSIALLGQQQEYELGPEAKLTNELRRQHLLWQESTPPPTLRSKVYLSLWQQMVQETATRQRQILSQLRTWAGLPDSPRPEYQCMSVEQLREMTRNNLFELGAHTVTHTALGYQSPEIQHQEILGSKSTLEDLIGSRTNSFSFPNGSHNQSARQILRSQGFRVAVTTHHSVIKKSTDPYQLGRFHVNNWSEAEFRNYLTRWLKGY